MAKFLCWLPDHGMTPADGGREVEVPDCDYTHRDRRAARAAELYVEWFNPQAAEYPMEREVTVRADDGTERTFSVETNMIPDYHARPKRKT